MILNSVKFNYDISFLKFIYVTLIGIKYNKYNTITLNIITMQRKTLFLF